jgi:hypothetical protein
MEQGLILAVGFRDSCFRAQQDAGSDVERGFSLHDRQEVDGEEIIRD